MLQSYHAGYGPDCSFPKYIFKDFDSKKILGQWAIKSNTSVPYQGMDMCFHIRSENKTLRNMKVVSLQQEDTCNTVVWVANKRTAIELGVGLPVSTFGKTFLASSIGQDSSSLTFVGKVSQSKLSQKSMRIRLLMACSSVADKSGVFYIDNAQQAMRQMYPSFFDTYQTSFLVHICAAKTDGHLQHVFVDGNRKKGFYHIPYSIRQKLVLL